MSSLNTTHVASELDKAAKVQAVAKYYASISNGTVSGLGTQCKRSAEKLSRLPGISTVVHPPLPPEDGLRWTRVNVRRRQNRWSSYYD